MQYIKVVWKHDHPNQPVLLYSELDDARWETRKVEVFRGDVLGYASKARCTESTMLGLEPIPSLSEIALQPEFEPHEITKEEFEQIWARANAQGP
jgi:hypothetical protein